jgi:aryl-alcohol dehydrogenase-like predicted oxidoreductase
VTGHRATQRPGLLLGTAQLAQPYGIAGRRARRDLKDGVRFLELAYELGIRRIDTAAAYGDAEATIGACRCPFTVDTKIAMGADPVRSVHKSLSRLQRSSLGVLYLHDPEVLREDPQHSLDEAATAAKAAEARLGVSVYEPEDVDLAMANGLIGAIQFPANLLDRRLRAGTRERAASQGVELLARSVFLQGALVSDPNAIESRIPGLGCYVESVRRLADELERSVYELALQWACSLTYITGVIVGAESEQQLEDLVASWMAEPLSRQELQLIEATPTPPARMIDPRMWA